MWQLLIALVYHFCPSVELFLSHRNDLLPPKTLNLSCRRKFATSDYIIFVCAVCCVFSVFVFFLFPFVSFFIFCFAVTLSIRISVHFATVVVQFDTKVKRKETESKRKHFVSSSAWNRQNSRQTERVVVSLFYELLSHRQQHFRGQTSKGVVQVIYSHFGRKFVLLSAANRTESYATNSFGFDHIHSEPKTIRKIGIFSGSLKQE